MTYDNTTKFSFILIVKAHELEKRQNSKSCFSIRDYTDLKKKKEKRQSSRQWLRVLNTKISKVKLDVNSEKTTLSLGGFTFMYN